MLPLDYVDKANRPIKDFFNQGARTNPPKFRYKTMTPRKNSFQKSAFRPESIVTRARNNSRVLDEIRQKPYSERNSSYSRGNSGYAKRGSYPLHNRAVKKGRPFSLSVPLIPALCVLFLGVFLILRHQDGILSMMHRDVIPAISLEDSGARQSMVNYAAINAAENSPRLMPQSVTEAPQSSETIPEENIGLMTIPLGNNIPPETSSSVDPVLGGRNPVADSTSLPENRPEALAEEPIPLRMVEYFAWEYYVVRRGDSVSRIAADHGLSYDSIIVSNNLANAHFLRAGQVIRLPNMNGIPYVVKPGDTISGLSRDWNIPMEVIVDVNNIQRDLLTAGQTIFLPGARMPVRDLRLAMGTLFIHPLRGASGLRMTSGFGWRPDPFTGVQRLHEAIDWAAPLGTAVRAASDGRVARVGTDPGYGRYIILSHSDNFETLYAHLSAVSVRQGDRITQGVKIGEVGNTGRSTGPHLHFALYRNRRAVNPLEFLTL